MEEDFQLKFVYQEGTGSMFPPLINQNIEQRCFNSSFSPFPSSNLEITKFDIPDYGNMLPVTTNPLAAFSYFDEDLLEFKKNQLLLQGSDYYEDQCLMIRSMNNDLEKLKHPKAEPVEEVWPIQTSIEPLNLKAEISDRSLNTCNSSGFYQMPDLRSVEQVSHHHKGKILIHTDDLPVVLDGEPFLKRLRSSSSPDSYTLEAILKNHFLPNPRSSLSLNRSPKFPTRKAIPQNVLARERRKLISERTQCLQKLMPWDKKLDMGTMLEEAYKYIKFLQAQVSVLQSMPCQSSFITTSQMMTANSVGDGAGLGGLEKLNRQQLLQVLVNSPVAQTVLYSQECCVYSLEQLILLKNKIVLQQMMSSTSSSSRS